MGKLLQRLSDASTDDAVTSVYKTFCQRMFFSSKSVVPSGAYLRDGAIILDGQVLMQTAEIPLRGLHNVENTMAAALIAKLAGASLAQIRDAVMSFPGVEHRIEFLGALNGVSWYNDSKATNVDATLKAIAAFDGGLWIILGGKDKGSDYSPLVDALKNKVAGVLLIGAAAPKIASQISGLPFQHCGTLEMAVRAAHAGAQPGDTVLLAPACASFDQFTSYEHRGHEFKRMAVALGVAR